MDVTDLVGRPVVELTTARQRGAVVDVLIDPTQARVVALEVAAPGREARERIPAASIARVGRDAVMLARSAAPEPSRSAGPEQEALDVGSLVGLEVLDEDGERAGYVRNARLEPDDLTVSLYELAQARWRRWRGERHQIRADEVVAWSRELLLVRARRPRSANGVTGGQPGSPTSDATDPEAQAGTPDRPGGETDISAWQASGPDRQAPTPAPPEQVGAPQRPRRRKPAPVNPAEEVGGASGADVRATDQGGRAAG
jgi:uncharacterized protein YrrD